VGAQGLTGSQGTQGTQGRTGVQGNTGIIYSNSTVSFWTDLNDTFGTGGFITAMVPSFDLMLSNPTTGWPILPHGGGAFYNLGFNYIGGVPTQGRPETYGEFVPCTEDVGGEIVAASVNYTNQDLGRQNYDVYVVNYSTGNFEIIGPAPSGNMTWNTSGSLCWAAPLGLGIPITGSSYIGLFVPVRGPGAPAPGVAIEGTVYFQLKGP